MIPDNQVIQNNNSLKKRNLLLYFVLVIFIFLNIFLFTLLKNKKDTRNKTSTSKLTRLSQKEGVTKYDISNLSVETPWNIDLDTTTNYYEPTIEELNKVYGNFLKSIYTRDYELFSKSVSARTKAIVDNNATFTKLNKDGIVVSTMGELRGEDYFISFFPERFRFQIPFEITYFQPQKLESFNYDPEPDFIIEDPISGKVIIKRDIAITGAKKLYYNNNYKFIDQNINHISYDYDGYATFVFENGKWVYRASDWQTQFVKDKAISLEDLDIKPETKRIVIDTKTDKNSAININIKSGDIIEWKNIMGVILSTDNNSNLPAWNSPFLFNNSFEKQFLTQGKINYQIGNITKDEIIKGVINVE